MTLIMILIAVILAGAGIFYLMVKSKNKEIEDLNVENHNLVKQLQQRERDVAAMKNHIRRVNLTEDELKPIKKEIKNAKTDQDVILAIGNIVRRNNSRLMPDND